MESNTEFEGKSFAKVLINGRPDRRVDVADRGFQYGDGVFTTVAVVRGIPVFLRYHLERLDRDAGKLGFPVLDRAVLAEEVKRMASAEARAVVKVMLTRGCGGRGYRPPQMPEITRVISLHPAPDDPTDRFEQGVTVRLCRWRLAIQPDLAGIKHLNRLEQVMARSEWDDGSIREGLLRDSEGHVVEGVLSNVFLVRQGRLLTPLLDRCGVSGVMRTVVMGLAAELGMSVDETRITVDELLQADEIFLTNSVIGIWPVGRFEQRTLSVGPWTRQLMARLNRMVDNEVAQACGG